MRREGGRNRDRERKTEGEEWEGEREKLKTMNNQLEKNEGLELCQDR